MNASRFSGVHVPFSPEATFGFFSTDLGEDLTFLMEEEE